jgi:hypothetical protein
MFVLFELRILSPLGPTISKIRVTIDGASAIVDNFVDQERDFDYKNNAQLLSIVFDNYENSFRRLEDSVIEIDAEGALEESIRDMLWLYHHEDEKEEVMRPEGMVRMVFDEVLLDAGFEVIDIVEEGEDLD